MKHIFSILLLLLTFCAQGQITESWNLDIATYTHNSSNYAPKNSPVEIVGLSNSDKVVLSQNGTLTKLNSKGIIIWQKEISNCTRQRIIVDTDDDIIMSCGYGITKFNSNGEQIWDKDYSSIFNKKYLAFDAITIDNSKIYLAGHFSHSKYICQLSIDTNGNVLWKTKFKQDVDYEHSFLPPKQIIINEGKIYILAHHYSMSNSFLYSSNLLGKKRRQIQVDYKIKKLGLKNDSLFALGHLNSFKDKLIFTKLNRELDVLEKSEFALPRNFDYKKAIRNWATAPPTKEEFEKEYITAYDIYDFEFLNTRNLLVVGNSYGKPWIANLDLNKGLVWNWDEKDSRYFNFNNDYSRHHYSLNTISQTGDKFLISGICEELDYKESGFKWYVNLFIREIELVK